jgi:hypothetical protein
LVESNLPVKSADVGHELTDLSPKSVALFAIVLALTMVAAVVVTAALFYRFYKVEIANQTAPNPRTDSGPQARGESGSGLANHESSGKFGPEQLRLDR